MGGARPVLAILLACAVSLRVAAAGDVALVGLKVTGLVPGGRGETAGIIEGDIVTACDGVALRGADQRRRLIDGLWERTTVAVDVLRDGRALQVQLVPGALDIYVVPYVRRYDLFLTAGKADERWNDTVREGFDAFDTGQWPRARELLQRAVDEGLDDSGVNLCLARAYLATAEAEKAYLLGERASAGGDNDPEWLWVRYWSAIMTCRPRKAAALRTMLPRPRLDWASSLDVKEDMNSLQTMGAAAGALGDGRPLAPVDPIRGHEGVEAGLQLKPDGPRETTVDAIWRYGHYWRWLEGGGYEEFGDFVVSCKLSIKGENAGHFPALAYVFVKDEQNEFQFHVGFDDRKSLLLGLNMPMVVGPCVAIDDENRIRIARKGGQLDAYINDLRVATVPVPERRPLKVWLGFRHGCCIGREIQVVTPGEPIRDPNEPAPPKIANAAPEIAVVDGRYVYALEIEGNPTPAVEVSGLPEWLAYDGGRVVSGIPGREHNGRSFRIRVVATNERGTDERDSTVAVHGTDPTLMGYWKFDEAGGDVAHDSSGKGNDCSVHGGRWSRGRIGGGLTLDGADNVVEAGALWMRTDVATITAWVKGVQNADFSGIVVCRAGSTCAGLLTCQGKLRYMWNDWGWDWESGLTIPADEWTFVGMVLEPSRTTLYVNGESRAHVTRHGVEAFDGPTHIGWDPNDTNRRWIGSVDDVHIYKRALSPAEMKVIADAPPLQERGAVENDAF